MQCIYFLVTHAYYKCNTKHYPDIFVLLFIKNRTSVRHQQKKKNIRCIKNSTKKPGGYKNKSKATSLIHKKPSTAKGNLRTENQIRAAELNKDVRGITLLCQDPVVKLIRGGCFSEKRAHESINNTSVCLMEAYCSSF